MTQAEVNVVYLAPGAFVSVSWAEYQNPKNNLMLFGMSAELILKRSVPMCFEVKRSTNSIIGTRSIATQKTFGKSFPTSLILGTSSCECTLATQYRSIPGAIAASQVEDAFNPCRRSGQSGDYAVRVFFNHEFNKQVMLLLCSSD